MNSSNEPSYYQVSRYEILLFFENFIYSYYLKIFLLIIKIFLIIYFILITTYILLYMHYFTHLFLDDFDKYPGNIQVF